MSSQNNLKLILPTAVGIVVLGLIGLLVWYWNQQFYVLEYTAIQEKNKPRINELYAAEVFLKKLHHPAQSFSSANKLIDQLPDHQDLIIYTNEKERLSNPIRRDALMKWVKSGGHLIITAKEELGSDPLLDDLGVHKKSIDSYFEKQAADAPEEDEETAEIVEPEKSENIDPEEKSTEIKKPDPQEDKKCALTPAATWSRGETLCELITVENPSLSHSAQLHFCTDYYLHDDSGNAIPMATDPWGLPHILQYQIGSGEIIVLESDDFLTNDRILYFDHAYFLSQLSKNRNKVWLLYQGASESLTQFLWKHAKLPILLFFTLLLVYLWRNMLRFGPLIQAPLPERRQLIEHIHASARFKWKHTDKMAEVEQLQTDILMSSARKQGRQQIDLEKEIDWLSRNSTLTESDIRTALSATVPKNPLELVALTQTLYQLRMLL